MYPCRMCGRYSLIGPFSKHIHGLADVLRHWPTDEERQRNLFDRYNIAPTQQQPVFVLGEAGPGAELMRWGLLPHWAKDAKSSYSTINARAESLTQKPAFRDAWRWGKRCLVPASGWYEWVGEKPPKQAWYLQAADGQNPIMFAGLWSTWTGPDGPINTYTIITTDAQGEVRKIHDRQPRIVQLQDWLAWLSADVVGAARWLEAEDVPVQAHRVSSLVGNPRNQGPALIEPLPAESD